MLITLGAGVKGLSAFFCYRPRNLKAKDQRIVHVLITFYFLFYFQRKKKDEWILSE